MTRSCASWSVLVRFCATFGNALDAFVPAAATAKQKRTYACLDDDDDQVRKGHGTDDVDAGAYDLR